MLRCQEASVSQAQLDLSEAMKSIRIAGRTPATSKGSLARALEGNAIDYDSLEGILVAVTRLIDKLEKAGEASRRVTARFKPGIRFVTSAGLIVKGHKSEKRMSIVVGDRK